MSLGPKTYLSRRIAVLVETDDSWGRSVIRGIADFTAEKPDWTLLIDPRDEKLRPALPAGWKGDGVIVRLSDQRQVQQIRSARVPAINVDTLMLNEPGFADVITDDDERAKLALEHLLDRGLANFAYFAPPSSRYSQTRGEAFQQIVEQTGNICHVYKESNRRRQRLGYSTQSDSIGKWLSSLPKPIGIFTVDAHQGRKLAEVCRTMSLRVPDEIALLAGDTDKLMCTVSTPFLSSVLLAAETIGRQSMILLEEMMRSSSRRPLQTIKIKPLGIESRRSTDVLNIDDGDLLNAVRFIQENAVRGIHVKDVLHQVPISRRDLELKFRKFLNRSPAEFIRFVQLEKAKQLLRTTDFSIAQVGKSCGFSSSTRFGIVFRRAVGLTPREWRVRATV